MNNLDINEDTKIKLLNQIYEYADKGYKLYRNYTLSDNINELQCQLTSLQHNEQIEKELEFYKFSFLVKCILLGKPIPSREELLKICRDLMKEQSLKY